MFKKLDKMLERFDKLNQLVSDPDVISKMDEWKAYTKELADITDELFGDAATDYIRAGELDDRRMTVEDRLMQLYEEEESFSVAEDMDE